MSGSQLRHRVEAGDKAWITQLNVNERSTLVATFAGWMLDGMDVMVYSLVLPTLISLWHISKGEAVFPGTFSVFLSLLGGGRLGVGQGTCRPSVILQSTGSSVAVSYLLYACAESLLH